MQNHDMNEKNYENKGENSKRKELRDEPITHFGVFVFTSFLRTLSTVLIGDCGKQHSPRCTGTEFTAL